MPRIAKLRRNTKETQISGELRIEGRGRYEISTGIRFLDHMLELFAKHGAFDLKIHAAGDLDIDQHHTVEDTGILIGQLFSKALGDRKGINRAGYFVLPMDETLAVVAVDLGGRPALVYRDKVRVRLVGDLQTELVEDFFGGFVHHAGANLHAKDSLRPLQPSQDRSHLQMLGACHALRLLDRRAPQRPAAFDERAACDRNLRLRRGQPAIRAEHPRRNRRILRTAARCRRACESHRRSSCPAWATSAKCCAPSIK